MKKLILFAMFPLFLSLFLLPVYAGEGDVDLESVPQQLATALGVELFVGQLLASTILIMLCLFPSMLIAGYWGGAGAVLYVILIVGLPVSGICVALGWLPIWLYAILCILIALMFSSQARGWLSGIGGKGD